jgi:1-acyl-sn-glycerol-3-phosphate acyltransferase
MKWVGKIELFRLPLVGWMMKLSDDIPVNRKDPHSGATMLLRALHVLEKHCSVIFFPEGTRSPDGRVGRFNDGAFHLAVKAQVPILPIAIEGSYGCLPKKSWRFGLPQTILLRLLSPVTTAGLSVDDVPVLRERIRRMILEQVAAFRGVGPAEVDALSTSEPVPAR